MCFLGPLPTLHPVPWAGGPCFGRSFSTGKEPESSLTRRAELHVSVRDTSESDPESNPNLRPAGLPAGARHVSPPQYSPLGPLLSLGEILLTQDE